MMKKNILALRLAAMAMLSSCGYAFGACEREISNLGSLPGLYPSFAKLKYDEFVNFFSKLDAAFLNSQRQELRRRISELNTTKNSAAYINAPANRKFGTDSRLLETELELCVLGERLASATQANNSQNQQNQSNQQAQQQPSQQNQSSQQQSQQGQQQSQQAQQQAQQTQQLAAQNQTRADQARQGQRRRHEPENEASHCIQPDFGGLYGGMKNTCDFKVWYTYCGYRPKENSWLTGMSCEKQSFGSDSVSPGRTSASHTKGVESIHWIACKEPAWTVDTEFVPGQGIKGRCHTVGGK